MRDRRAIHGWGSSSDRELAVIMAWVCVPLPLAAVVGPQVLWSAAGWDEDVTRYFLTPLVAILFWLVANGVVELTGAPIPRRERRDWLVLLLGAAAFIGIATLVSTGPVGTTDPGVGDGFAFLGFLLLGVQWLAAVALTVSALRHAWWLGHPSAHGPRWRMTA